MATINALYQCAELADIKKWLSDADLSTKIDDLLAEFNRLKDYKNAVEWNHLVTLCEAITMLDTWEKFNLEPLEAFCQKGLSGSWATALYNANWYKHAGSWRDWSKSGDSFVIYKGADSNNYGVTKLNSQRNMLPTNPFKIGRFLGNCQQSVKSFVAEVSQLNTNFEAHMQPKHYGDGFYYAKINTNFSRHDWPGHPSVQSQYFHAQSDMPADCKNGYVEPHMSFGKLSTRRNRLCWAVDLYYTRAWGELPLAQQKQNLADDLAVIFAELEKKLSKKKVVFDTKLAIEYANSIIKQWLNTRAEAKYYQRIENEFTEAKEHHERFFS